MSDSVKTCDLCGWPIEEWQPVTDDSHISVAGSNTWTFPRFEHRNPADCRPTRKPPDAEDIELARNFRPELYG